jgi:AraC-like DNA-binding protein
MDMNHFKPMFDFERLYWPPFTRRRGFDEERWVTVWHQFDGQPESTGIPIIDSVVQQLHDGRAVTNVAIEYGISNSDLSAVLRVFTGMSTLELEHRWRLRVVDDLLRYTNLRISDIARRCGYLSTTALSRSVMKQTKQSPTARRRSLRHSGDIGKFGL